MCSESLAPSSQVGISSETAQFFIFPEVHGPVSSQCAKALTGSYVRAHPRVSSRFQGLRGLRGQALRARHFT